MTHSSRPAALGENLVANKDDLRTSMRQKRRSRSPEQMSDVAEALGRMWPTLRLMAEDPDIVLGYQPTRFEPDPRNLLGNAISDGFPVLLPRPFGSERLEWVSAEGAHLHSRQTKFPSPPGPTVGVGSGPMRGRSALILIPALAADPSTGMRLGQGGGYYDRLIGSLRETDCRALLVTIVHDDELLQVPALPHDQTVDVILTESELHVIGKG